MPPPARRLIHVCLSRLTLVSKQRHVHVNPPLPHLLSCAALPRSYTRSTAHAKDSRHNGIVSLLVLMSQVLAPRTPLRLSLHRPAVACRRLHVRFSARTVRFCTVLHSESRTARISRLHGGPSALTPRAPRTRCFPSSSTCKQLTPHRRHVHRADAGAAALG